MAKDKAAKAVGKEQKKDRENKKSKSSNDASKPKMNGDVPLEPKAGPSSENSTVATKTADKSSKKKDKTDKKGKSNSETSSADTNGAPDAELDENAILLREIKSLGGTEEDFEMLKDVDTDNEEAAQDAEATADDVSESFCFRLTNIAV